MPDSLQQRLFRHAESEPNRLLIHYSGQGRQSAVISTHSLLSRAQAFAHELTQAGLERQRVILLFPTGPEFIIAFLGTMIAEATAVPMPLPQTSKNWERLTPSLKDAEPSLVLTSVAEIEGVRSYWQETFPDQHAAIWSLDAQGHTQRVGERKPLPRTKSFPGLALIQYTSGSTSSPKGVCLTHENLSHNLAAIEQAFGHTQESRGVIWLPHHHDMGLVGGLLSPLYTGFELELIPPFSFVKRPLQWLKTISNRRATSSGGPNFAYDLCVRAWSRLKPAARPSLDLRSWEIAFVGAEPVRAATLDRFVDTFAKHGFNPDAFFPCYGLAESTLIATGGPRGKGYRALDIVEDGGETEPLGGKPAVLQETNATRRFIAVGGTVDPLSKLQILPRQSDSNPMKEGHVGEITLSGPSISPGYWSNLKHVHQAQTQAVLRTGDLGCQVDGQLYVVGRISDLIIIDGRNYDPADLEFTTQNAHPALESVRHCAFSIDADQGEALTMIAEVDPRWRQTGPAAIQTAIRRAIVEQHGLALTTIHLVPRGTVSVTTSGKVRRAATRKKFLRSELPPFTFRSPESTSRPNSNHLDTIPSQALLS